MPSLSEKTAAVSEMIVAAESEKAETGLEQKPETDTTSSVAIPPIATDVTVVWSVRLSVCHTRALR